MKYEKKVEIPYISLIFIYFIIKFQYICIEDLKIFTIGRIYKYKLHMLAFRFINILIF
jgi:hypothetical protein